MSLNIGTLVGYLQLDDTQFNRKADAADKKINGLKLHLEALGKSNPKISVEVDTETKKLEELQAHIAELKTQAAQGIDVRVDMVAALVKLDALQAKIRSLHNAEIKVHVDDKAAIDRLDLIQKKVDGLGSKGGLFGSALAFGPAFLPMINAVPGALFAIGSGAVATAGGVGVLALAFHGLGDSVKAYQDYEAKLPFAKNAKQIAELKKQLALSEYGSQNASGREFTRTLATKGSAAGGQIKSAAQAGVFPGATRALNDIIPLVPVVSRLMKSLGTTVGDMTDETAKALNSPFWRQWFKWLGEDAKTQLPLVGSIFGHTFEGIMRAIQRFSPQGTSILQWLDDLTQRFDNWTGSPEFDDFMKHTAENSHAVADALREVAPVVKGVYEGLSGAGLAELKVFGSVMEGVAHLPTGALQVIGATLPLIFLGLKGIALTSSVTTGLTSLGGAFTTLQGKISGTKVEATNGQKAIAGLAGAGGLALLTMASQQSSQSMGVLEGALGGALAGFAATGNPIGALIGAAGGGLLGLFTAGNKAADGIDESARAAREASRAVSDYSSTLEGFSAAATNATRKEILKDIKSKKGRDLLGSLGQNDTQLLNLVTGGEKAVARIFKLTNASYKQASEALYNQRAVLDAAKKAADAPGLNVDQRSDAEMNLQTQRAIYDSLADQAKIEHDKSEDQETFLIGLRKQQDATRQLNAEALDFNARLKMGVPKPIAHLIAKEGVIQDIGHVADLIQKFHVVGDTKWKAVLKAEGLTPTADNLSAIREKLRELNNTTARPKVDANTGQAMSAINALKSLLASLHDRNINVNVNKNTNATVGEGAANTGRNDDGTIDRDHNQKTGKGQAGGGTVAGRRMPYGDKVLTPTAPGEEIISNNRGQADMNREVLKAANAGARIGIVGFAGGGTVPDPLSGFGPEDVPGSSGGSKGHHHKGPSKAHQKAAHEKELRRKLAFANNQLSQARAAISAAQEWSSSFAGNAFSQDFGTRVVPGAVTTSIINGMKVTQSGASKTVANTPQEILTSMLAYQQAQKTQAQKLAGWVGKLRKEGVSNAVLKQMEAAGPQGIAQIQALASGSVAQVKKFNSLNAGTTASLNETGAQATSGKHYTDLQRQKMNEESQIRALSKVLHKPVPVRVVTGDLRP